MKKILVVDDEQPTRQFMSNFFKELGYEVDAASSGMEALRLTETLNPNLILLDLQMPGMDGAEVLKKIRSKNKNIKILILTGVVAPKIIEHVLQLGADHYLTKPVPLHELEKEVREMLKEA